MNKNEQSEPAAIWVSIIHPEWQRDIDCSHCSGPITIGSGYDNDLVIDGEGVFENHCVIEAFVSGVRLRPLDGQVVDAENNVLYEPTIVSFGQVLRIGAVGFEILRQREGHLRQRFGWPRAIRVFDKAIFYGFLMSARLTAIVRASMGRMTFGAKIAACLLIIVGVGSVVTLDSTARSPLPDPLPVPAVSEPAAGFPRSANGLGMKAVRDDHELSSGKLLGEDRDAAFAKDLDKIQNLSKFTRITRDDAAGQSAKVALEALGGDLQVSHIKNGVATLQGQLASKHELQKIEETLALDVPALVNIDSSAVRLADRPVKLDLAMLPAGIAAVWAGADPYIEMNDGTKYWEGSVLQDGTEILSIELDKIHVSRDGDRQSFDIEISGQFARE